MEEALGGHSAEFWRLVCDDDTGFRKSGIAALHHINLRVPDFYQAMIFYSEGLGLTYDVNTQAHERGGFHVSWFNMLNSRGEGASQSEFEGQQFHIVKKDTADVLNGLIVLSFPSLDRLYKRLSSVKDELAGTEFDFWFLDTSKSGARKLVVQCPWGNHFMVEEPAVKKDHPDYFVGIKTVVFYCRSGEAEPISKYYNRYFSAGAEKQCGMSGPDESGNDDKLTTTYCTVSLGSHSHLVFVEDDSHIPEGYPYSLPGLHLAIFIDDFAERYEKIAKAGLIDNDHHFRDKCYSLEDAQRNRQFRVRDIPNEEEEWGAKKEGGQHSTLAQLQLEVRSKEHPSFGSELPFGRGKYYVREL